MTKVMVVQVHKQQVEVKPAHGDSGCPEPTRAVLLAQALMAVTSGRQTLGPVPMTSPTAQLAWSLKRPSGRQQKRDQVCDVDSQ